MIGLYDAIFGCINTIVFQLAERIAITEKSMKSVIRNGNDIFGLMYLAIPTRHEEPSKPYLQYQ